MALLTSTIGYPRIGGNREAKTALERHWKGQSTTDELLGEVHRIQGEAWLQQRAAGIDLVGADGTLYDQVLDVAFALSIVPKRHLPAQGEVNQPLGLDVYFAMARGKQGAPALDLSKYMDSNYHYLVPELDLSTWRPTAVNHGHLVEKVKRCQATVGAAVAVPMMVGPLTVASLAKQTGGAQLPAAEVVQRLVPAFKLLLQDLAALQVPEVQIHEPILVTSNGAKLEAAARQAYAELAAVGVPINLVTSYDDLGDAYPWVVQLPVSAIGLDFIGVPGASKPNLSLELVKRHGFPAGKRLGAGVVDGRSVWADTGLAPAIIRELLALGVPASTLSVQSSVSLQHLPLDVERETSLDPAVKARLGFAKQKLGEIVRVARDAAAGGATPAPAAGAVGGDVLAAFKPKPYTPNPNVNPAWFHRSETFETRRPKQVQLPAFPTTTIGSFPQTAEVRRQRLLFRQGRITEAEYLQAMAAQIGFAIGVQEAVGVDVLVHGEPERTDMVEFFGQYLRGMTFTLNGWVQSYGSRYVRPPLVVSDIEFTAEMTVREFKLAQSLTARPVKGMLTGPITILNWSFPRRDISRQEQAEQLALALRQEVVALEKAGCKVVQVDEPALREGLPLKESAWQPYLDWAVAAFRLTCSGAAPETQVVTHLCYSDFDDILGAIHDMDADVLTIENSRSDDEMVRALVGSGYNRDVGPGVYDVHSPVVPTTEFIKSKLQLFVDAGALRGQLDRLWNNPDCGLKTRGWAEVLPALKNMVEASRQLREALAPKN